MMKQKILYFVFLFLPAISYATAPQFLDYQPVCTNNACYIEGTIYISPSGTGRLTFKLDQDVDLEIWRDAETTGTLLYSKPGYFQKDVQITMNLTSNGFEIQEGSNAPENVPYTFNQNITVQLIIVIKNSSSEKASKNVALLIDSTAPEPPTGVYAKPGDKSAIVHWSESSSTDVKYYNVYYRQEGTGEFSLSGSTNTSTETSFTVGGLENGVTYEFGVSAVDRVLNEGSIKSVQDDGQPVKATPAEIIGLHGLSPEEEGGCFIATAVYSENSKEVQILRQFRDRFLLNNWLGKLFVNTYYLLSPPIADFIRSHMFLKTIGAILLTPVVVLAEISLHYPVVFPLLILCIVIINIYFVKGVLKSKG
jgi:hypothetical protein